jgi:ADP-heptose:LPS heptosyltransferase/predicted O-linked N-acetylglucosamine transferase (SPINDLY family)
MKTEVLKTLEEQKMMSRDTRHIHIGTHALIESLQIYTEQLADEFQQKWQQGIDYLRFERVSLPADTGKTLAADLILRSADGKHILTILGILIKEDGIYFPSLLKNWRHENIVFLYDSIVDKNKTIEPTKNAAIFQLNSTPAILLQDVTAERMIPGIWAYNTVIAHIKRYSFLLNCLRPGKILECACGVGYGAIMLSQINTVTEYYGVDLSKIAVAYSNKGAWNDKLSFNSIDLAESAPSLYENVVSLETIEHVPNPYKFVEILIDKMSPDGQLLISIPNETFYGSHVNPYHLSNWNYKRLYNFLEQYFEDIIIFSQKCSQLGASTFETSNITENSTDVDSNGIFISILRRPRKKKRPNIILKRQWAMGDVIWATPILRDLRRLYPNYNVLVVSDKTEVFLHNPDVDLVFTTRYEPLPDDLFIDLDWAYEKRRELHILHAYAEASGIPPASTQPALYPTIDEFRLCAKHILHHFQYQGVERLVALHMPTTISARNWPKAFWVQFLSDLLQQDKKLGIVVLGHGRDFSAADLGFSTDSVLCLLVHQLSLMHTAAVLSLCDLLVAPDSGILHVAAAVNVPYLGLFGMADPATRLPFTTRSRALWADIECRGCFRTLEPTGMVRCPHESAVCMERILPGEVLSVTKEMLEAASPGRWKSLCQMAFPGAAAGDLAHSSRMSPLKAGIQAFNHENFEGAIECLSTAMTQEPDNPLPYAYLAFVCVHQGLIHEARDFITQSIRIAPERADLIAALGEIFLKNGRPSEAAEYLREAVHVQPDFFAAYPALAQSLHLIGQSDEAVSFLQTASNLPSNAQANIRNTLLQVLAERGDLSGFAECTARFSQGLPDDLLAARCLARFDENGEALLETLSRIQNRLENEIHAGQRCAEANATQSGLTRIAFMVGDFTSHQQLEQIYALFRHLPTERFFTLFISCNTHPPKDEMAQMCVLIADAFLNINLYEDSEAVEKLCTLTPDILIDTEAYAPSERLAVFLAAPVPHKLLWGEAPIPPIAPDVRTLAGARLSVENMLPAVTLPEMGEVFDLPELPFTDDAARGMGKPPVLGCLVPAARIGHNGWQLFAETLSQIPDATLIVNLAELGRAAETFISRQFSSAGVDPARLVFTNASTAEEYCLAWQSIDLGLLPPVNPGGLALPTCLWMGRPCLVLGSILPWSQRPIALLKALGKEGWVATDTPHYVNLVKQLAPPGQRTVPDPTLRESMMALGLTDAEGFARGFAEAMSGLTQSDQYAPPDTSEGQ